MDADEERVADSIAAAVDYVLTLRNECGESAAAEAAAAFLARLVLNAAADPRIGRPQ